MTALGVILHHHQKIFSTVDIVVLIVNYRTHLDLGIRLQTEPLGDGPVWSHRSVGRLQIGTESLCLLTDSGGRPWRGFVLCGKSFGTAVRFEGYYTRIMVSRERTDHSSIYPPDVVDVCGGWWWTVAGNKIKVRI